MKIGYPCINRSIGCTANRTFRLASYSEDRLAETVRLNLACLKKTLEYNVRHGLLFFRIGSSLVPFASHPICTFNWQRHFRDELKELGDYIKEQGIRISMHPDQFVLINSHNPEVVTRSVSELVYHCELLESLGLDKSAKIQIHVGGVYGAKDQARERFSENYRKLPEMVRQRLAIENDHLSYSLKDCLLIHEQTGIPVIFDFFHHACLHNGENRRQALEMAAATWSSRDGVIMTDYSSQKNGAVQGSHADSLDESGFRELLEETAGLDFDIMLEIKDKELSALEARRLLDLAKNNNI